jgi:hypothetical protein
VLDGGDLRDVERMLARMGTPSVRLTAGVPTGDEVPRRLLVTSGRRSLEFDQRTIDKGPWLKRDLKVYLPAEFTGKGPLALPASIVRSERCGRETLVSMAFHRDARTRARVSALLPQLRRGPVTLPS